MNIWQAIWLMCDICDYSGTSHGFVDQCNCRLSVTPTVIHIFTVTLSNLHRYLVWHQYYLLFSHLDLHLPSQKTLSIALTPTLTLSLTLTLTPTSYKDRHYTPQALKVLTKSYWILTKGNKDFNKSNYCCGINLYSNLLYESYVNLPRWTKL